MATELPPTDSTGRPVLHGDLIRADHFTTARKRKVYLYKIAVRTDAAGTIRPDGEYWMAIDVHGIVRGLDEASRCRLDVVGRFEVIDGPYTRLPDGGLESWWERKKVKVTHGD